MKLNHFIFFINLFYFILFCMTKYNNSTNNNNHHHHLGSEMKSNEKEGA